MEILKNEQTKPSKNRLKGTKNKLELPKRGVEGGMRKVKGDTVNNIVTTLLSDKWLLPGLVWCSHHKIRKC